MASGTEVDVQRVVDLFPSFDPTLSEGPYDLAIDDIFIEDYAEIRAVGLSAREAAHAAGISSALIDKLLQGEGLSLDRFVELAKAELFAEAEFKKTHFKNLKDAAAIEWRASIALLEKLFPEDYTPKLKVENHNTGMSAAECSASADAAKKAARERLEELREEAQSQ